MDIFNDPTLKIQRKVPIEGEIGDIVIFNPEPIPKEDLCKMLIVDTETTGFNYLSEEIIEIAGVTLYVNKTTGEAHSVELSFDYFREPTKASISEEITNITGITWAMVCDKRVNFEHVLAKFRNADIIVAHNAAFDRPFVESLLPDLMDLKTPWVCSCHDPNWTKLGFHKKGLEALLAKKMFWYDAHLAINDCNAVAYLLYMHPEVVKLLIDFSTIETYKLNLVKTPYGYNDGIKGMGFRWDSKKKHWVNSFSSTDEVIDIRDKLQKLYGTSFSGVVMTMDTINPSSRFSKRV